MVTLANNNGPNESQDNAAFHQCLHYLLILKNLQCQEYIIYSLEHSTVVPTKSDSDAMFCLQSYQ